MATKLELAQAQFIGFSHASKGNSLLNLTRIMGLSKAEWLKIRLTSSLNLGEIEEVDYYFDNTLRKIEHERYCIIVFSKNNSHLKGDIIEELPIYDKKSLDRILRLGFNEEEMNQSYDFKENVSYLDSHPIYFRDNETRAKEYKNKMEAIGLVQKLCILKKFRIDYNLNCFHFSFPARMFY